MHGVTVSMGDKLSEELRKLRGMTGRSQADIADRLGISRATLNRWEGHGAGAVTIEQLERLGDVFGIQPSDLIRPQGVAAIPRVSTHLLPALLEIATLLPALKEGELDMLLRTVRALAKKGDNLVAQVPSNTKKAR